MPKFKIGDYLEPVEIGRGFNNAYVMGIYTSKTGKWKGQEMYLLKIMNGTASIPVSAEVNYKLKKK